AVAVDGQKRAVRELDRRPEPASTEDAGRGARCDAQPVVLEVEAEPPGYGLSDKGLHSQRRTQGADGEGEQYPAIEQIENVRVHFTVVTEVPRPLPVRTAVLRAKDDHPLELIVVLF